MDFRAGDVGYIQSSSDVSRSEWPAMLPPEPVQHLGLDATLVASFLNKNEAVVPTEA